MRRASSAWVLGAMGLLACGHDADDGGMLSGGTSDAQGDTTTSGATNTRGAEGTSGSADSAGPIYDVGTDEEIDLGGGAPPSCKVEGPLDAVGPCETHAPADSFEPVVQWVFDGDNGEVNSVTTPLVANLTDDNGDGEIDLCDVPDVLVVAYAYASPSCGQICPDGHIYVLDGADGSVHYRIDRPTPNTSTPAIGDIDGDGIPEIVAQSFDPMTNEGLLVAYEHDGTQKWVKPSEGGSGSSAAVALADLDVDGDVEILVHGVVHDHDGNEILEPPTPDGYASLAVAADLDDDDDLEIIGSGAAFHHDGTVYFDNPSVDWAHPQVADLDDDPQPEILFIDQDGVTILEHDGTTKMLLMDPTAEGAHGWGRPAAIHDFDADGIPQIGVKSDIYYAVLEADGSLSWKTAVNELSGMSGGTAFDFLGDGSAEAMYADEHYLFAFDGLDGTKLFHTPRSSWTMFEYPTVADVDNDGSAEVLVVSNDWSGPQNPSHALQVLRNVDDLWVPARRIWNQHTYHVTNVREDGTIPSPEPHHWELLNTFRTQAQAENGVCKPDPAG